MHDTTTVFVTVLPSNLVDPVPSGAPPAGNNPGGNPSDSSSPDDTPSDGSAGTSDPADGTSDNTPSDGSSGNGSNPSNPSDGAPPYSSPEDSASGESPPGDSSPGDSIPGGSQPGDTDTDSPQGNGQGAPEDGPPFGSNEGTAGPVKPFTTLTIDIWGTRGAPDASASDSLPQATSTDSGVITDRPAPVPSRPASQPGGGSSDIPQAPDDNTDPSSQPDFQPGESSGNAPAPGPNDSPYGNADPNSGGPDSGDASSPQSDHGPATDNNPSSGDDTYSNPDESPVFVTDGQPVPSWPGQGSPPAPQITSPNDGSPSSPDDAGSGSGTDDTAPQFVTIIGSDGQPTVVSHPWGHDSGSGGLPDPTDVYASDADAQSIPYPASSGANALGPAVTGSASPGGAGDPNSDDSGVVTCITVLGDDGKPTVVDFTGPVPGPLATAGPLSETAVTDSSALAQSMTIIGADGHPTVVSSPWGRRSPPGGFDPAATALPGPDSGIGNSDDGGISSGPQVTASSATCITILGNDGKPTVVDWPWDGSGPGATSAPFSNGPGDNGNGNGGVLTDGSALPQGPMTHASFTILGPDGLPTVVETNWPNSPTDANAGGIAPQGPIVSQASISDLPSGISVQLPLPTGPVPGEIPGADSAPTDCITILGPDGKPTVVEVTGGVPVATGGPVVGPGATLSPPVGSEVPSLPLPPFPDTASGGPAGGIGGNPGSGPLTTCTSYTLLGADGLPTVVETTWVIPPAFETGSALATDASGAVTAPAGQVTGAPGLPDPQGGNAITTCSTYTVIGADGQPSAVETTFAVPAQASDALASDAHLTSGIQAAPWSAVSDGPAPPSADNAGSPGAQHTAPSGPLTTCITVMTTGGDGVLTATEQTVILPAPNGAGLPSGATDQSALPLTTSGLPGSSPTGPVIDNGSQAPGNNGDSNISGYGSGPMGGDTSTVAPPVGTDIPGASVDPVTAGEPTITVTGFYTSTLTIIANPSGGPIISGPSGLPLPDYGTGDSQKQPLPVTANAPSQASGADLSEETLFPASDVAYGGAGNAGVPVTSTWSNAIPQGTTTYLLKFPLTTLATVPAKRHLRR